MVTTTPPAHRPTPPSPPTVSTETASTETAPLFPIAPIPSPFAPPGETPETPERPDPAVVAANRARQRHEEAELRQRVEHRAHAGVVDQSFEAMDVSSGDDADGNVSESELRGLADGNFDRDAVEAAFASDGLQPDQIDERVQTLRGTARYFLEHSFDGDDINISRGDVDRDHLSTIEDVGPAAAAPMSRQHQAEAQRAYDRFSEPGRLQRALGGRDLSSFTEPELSAIAALNAEEPSVRERIGDATRRTVENAETFAALPQGPAFQLLLADHPNDEAIRPLVDAHVDGMLDDVLRHRKGDDHLELALERFGADLQDLRARFPAVEGTFVAR